MSDRPANSATQASPREAAEQTSSSQTTGADRPAGVAAPQDVAKSYLSQRFGRLDFGQYSLIGYSVAGEETLVQVPQLNVCFDIGRAPQFALTSDIVCISHGHMDHIAGLAYYLSQRYFQGMKPGTVLLPEVLADPVDTMLKAWQRIERQTTPYELVPMKAGEMHRVRKDFGIRAVQTHHGSASLGYALISIREKLKPEYHDRPGDELARMKRDGVEIQYTLEVPLVTYLGDTAAGPVFEEKDVVEAQILVTECTFYEKDHLRKSKAGKHLHVEQFAKILPTLRNQHVVILHVSRRTGVPRAMRLLRKRAGDEATANVHFLLDLKDAKKAGDAAAAAGVSEEA